MKAELTPPSVAATWFYRSLLTSRWPWAEMPNISSDDENNSNDNSVEKMKELYVQGRHVSEALLPSVWSDMAFRESCRMGKYSRWVLNERFDDGTFLIDLAWAVRLLYCLGPESYLTLDGADVSVYNPKFSMSVSDSPGWRLGRHGYSTDIQQKLLFDRDAYVALEVLSHSVSGHAFFQVGNAKMPIIAQILEEQPEIQLQKNKKWKRAMDLEEHTKLLSFLLRNPESRRALFWDADGVCCRGVELLAKERFESWRTLGRCYAIGQPHYRQLPHMFNMAKLGQHVEALSWEECCT